MDLGLRDRVAIVCAASKGLGKAAAAGLAAEGARLVICSRDETRIRAAAEEISRKAPDCALLPVAADVRRPEDVTRVVSASIERFGRIDILVTNAGGPPVAEFLHLDDEEWAEGVGLTLMSVVRLIRAALPHMQRRRWGRIINITSVAAKQPINDLVLSSTLRPGILGLTRVLANRYGAEGILINSVAPGFILTARQEELMQARARDRSVTTEQYLDEVAREIPMRRLGRPEELADVIVFLASERASYVNGATISVDGGLIRGLL